MRPLCRSVSSACVGSRRCPTQSYIRPNIAICKSSSGGGAVCDLALINVDYISPSLWLGVVLGITGMILYSLKFRDAKGTTEGDIVAASLFVMCGGILTLQGWRLDPILMLSEFVLGGVGIFYMVQTVNLRKQLEVCTYRPASIMSGCLAHLACLRTLHGDARRKPAQHAFV